MARTNGKKLSEQSPWIRVRCLGPGEPHSFRTRKGKLRRWICGVCQKTIAEKDIGPGAVPLKRVH